MLDSQEKCHLRFNELAQLSYLRECKASKGLLVSPKATTNLKLVPYYITPTCLLIITNCFLTACGTIAIIVTMHGLLILSA